MTVFPTLYKRTTTGKVQIWFVEVDGDRYRTTSGQQDGKKVTTEWTIAKPKNEGKANATTGPMQAVAEVNAMYEKQYKRDYRNSVEEIDSIERFKPMLADKWGDRKDKITVNYVHMQPKLDGIRCIAKLDGLWTRNGERIHGAPHIYEQLMPLFDKMPDLILDGELYNHDFKDDFNAIVSCVKKTKPTEEDLKLSEERIQYWVYDMPSDTHFGERNKTMQNIIDFGLEAKNSIVIVQTAEVHKDDVDKTAAIYIEAGYEGAMVRLPGKYENKRSKTLLKWKEFQDEEFPIVDIQEGDGNRAGMAARVILSLPDGRTFAAGLIGNVDYCKKVLADKDKHIGKSGTVVFQHYTPDGVPRFPKFKTIRDYE
jgi:DNA ligase-1